MNKNSLVPFIKNQFPQHIAETESLLVPFMEAYYEWMHLENNIYDVVNNISRLHSIDESLEKFSDEFAKEYLSNFPTDIVTDKATTIKHINDLYKAKGTPAAVKLLIKLILGKESEIFYPSSQILRASDGEWIQDNSIYVSVTSGDIFSIVGESVKISTNALSFDTVVEKVRLTKYTGIYEVFLERKLIYDISQGSILSFNDVIAEAQSTITNYNVLQGGTGFRVGQIFEIASADGSGTVVKIKSITSSGGIKSVQIIRFGYGYQSEFIIGLSSQVDTANIETQFPFLSDSTDGITDEGLISLANYFDYGYMDGTYVGKILTTFKDSVTQNNDGSEARIKFTLGSKLKYPGYYNSVKGFLSNSIYLQDNLYYQIYSYVVRIDEELDAYESKVLNTVHPAGMKLFGEYTINNNFSLNTKLTFILNFFRLVLDDVIAIQEVFAKTITKPLSDTTTPVDAKALTLTKPFADSTAPTDASTILTTKFISDVFSLSEATVRSITKILTDTQTVNDDISKSFSTMFNDTPAFGRASTALEKQLDGSYLSVSNDVLRQDVIESDRNLLWYSQDFTNTSVWARSNILSITANQVNGPEGNLTADLLIPNTTNANHQLEQVMGSITSFPDNTITSGFIDVAPAGYNFISLFLYYKNGSAGSARFDLTSGAVSNIQQGTGGSGVTASTIALANGFYRCIIENANVQTGATVPRLRIFADDGTTTTFAGDGTSGYYLANSKYKNAPTINSSNNIITTDGAGFNFSANGIKFEQKATNWWTDSRDGNQYNIKSAMTYTANTVISPDGTTNADSYRETTANSGHYIERQFASGINGTNRQSATVIIKPVNTRRFFWLTIYSNGYADGITAFYDLSTGIVYGNSSNGTGVFEYATIEPLNNGYWKLTVTGIPSATSNNIIRCRLSIINGSTTYVGATNQGFEIWHSQLENGDPTSPIYTTSSIATRDADGYVIDATAITLSTSVADTTAPTDATSLTTTKSLVDSFTQTDDVDLTFGKSLSDSSTIVDDSIKTFTKYINETLTPDDSGYTFYNYYSDVDYWSPDYSQGSQAFT
jgi:hypothetical protein